MTIFAEEQDKRDVTDVLSERLVQYAAEPLQYNATLRVVYGLV
jgi:hypothetical protein